MVRSVFIASFFGTTGAASALQIAIQIPYVFRRILGESALDAFFVPVYTSYVNEGDRRRTEDFVSNVMTIIGSMVLVIIAVGWVIMPLIIFVQAAGLKSASPADFTYAVSLARITLPFMFFISMLALFSGLMNFNRNFILPAANSLILNVMFIGVLAYFGHRAETVYGLGVNFASTYVFGGLFLFILQAFYIRKNYGFRYRFRFDLRGEGIRRIFRMMVPAIGSMAVVHINIMVDTLLASFLGVGVISVIRYAETIIQFPIGVIGVAVFNTSLPSLSSYVKAGNMDRAREIFHRLLYFIVIIGLPVSVGLYAIRREFVAFLYQYKNFGVADTAYVVNVLQFYIIGLIGFFGVRIVSTLFYAKEEIHIPFKVGMCTMGLNIVLNIILMQFMGAGGLALASSIAAIANISILVHIVNKKYFKIHFSKLAEVFLKSAISAAVMFAAVRLASGRIAPGGFFMRAAGVLLPVCAGAAVYLFCAYLLHVPGIRDLASMIRGRFKKM